MKTTEAASMSGSISSLMSSILLFINTYLPSNMEKFIPFLFLLLAILIYFYKPKLESYSFNKKTDLILTENILPSIHAAIRNRYYILLGIFGYYGFILAYNLKEKLNWEASLVFGSVIMFVVMHNYINYYLNAKKQFELIRKNKKELFSFWHTKLEWSFALLTFTVLGLANYRFYKQGSFSLLASIIICCIIIFCCVNRKEKAK